MKKKITVVVLALILAVICLIAGILTGSVDQLVSSDKYVDPDTYFGEEGAEGPFVIVDGEVREAAVWQWEGAWYMEWKTAASILGSRMYIDEAVGEGLMVLPQETLAFTKDSTAYVSSAGMGGDAGVRPIDCMNDQWGVSLDYLMTCMDVDIVTCGGEADETGGPLRLIVYKDWANCQMSRLEDETRVREEESNKARVVEKLGAGAQVQVLSEGEEWTRVMTAKGFCGYVMNDELSQTTAYRQGEPSREPEYTHKLLEGQICLGWHQMTGAGGNDGLEERVSGTCLNVISPTWFTVLDTIGNISSLASADYVARAHELGLQVWGLIDNFTGGADMDQFYVSKEARTRMITQLIEQAKACGMDGVNLDFESVREHQAPHYIQLVRELSSACRQAGLILSVDDPVPQFSVHYNRREQAKYADYLIIMGYDENYSGSETAGSNASLPFVTKAVSATLNEAEASRVILGMPFYTRLWIESYGTGALECQTISMLTAQDYMLQNNLEGYWDAEAGQNVIEQDTGEELHHMWMEDARSLEEKLKVMDSYQLAGGAFWKLGFEDPAVWETIKTHF